WDARRQTARPVARPMGARLMAGRRREPAVHWGWTPPADGRRQLDGSIVGARPAAAAQPPRGVISAMDGPRVAAATSATAPTGAPPVRDATARERARPATAVTAVGAPHPADARRGAVPMGPPGGAVPDRIARRLATS